MDDEPRGGDDSRDGYAPPREQHHQHGHGYYHAPHRHSHRSRNAWRTNKQNLVTFATVLAILAVIAGACAIVVYNRRTASALQSDAFEQEAAGQDSAGGASSARQGGKGKEGLGIRFMRATSTAGAAVLIVEKDGADQLVRLRGIECLDGANRRNGERQGAELNLDWDKVKWYAEASASFTLAFIPPDGRVAVRLPLDQPEPTDELGQLLAYVEVEGKDLGAELIRRGLAMASRENHPRLAEYTEIEEAARRDRIGIFGAL